MIRWIVHLNSRNQTRKFRGVGDTWHDASGKGVETTSSGSGEKEQSDEKAPLDFAWQILKMGGKVELFPRF